MSNTDTLKTALHRLSQLQGSTLDSLKLNACLERAQGKEGPAGVLKDVCSQLALPGPRMLNGPDRALLPMLVMHPKSGWGVVTDQDVQGGWIVEFGKTRQVLHLKGVDCTVACVSTHEQSDEDSDDTFRSAFSKELKHYRGVIVEAALATAFMGLLTLGISLFSMQVYDRVIPTRSGSTLFVLSGGVLLAIVLELVMKFARSHIMDAVVAGMDGRLSRIIFQRLLNVRVDELPGSVGSLAAQIRGYEQVRAFYTAGTLFTLVDLPMSLAFIAIIAVMGNPLAGLVPLVYGAIAIMLGIAVRKRLGKLAVQGAQVSNLKTGLLVEAVEGAETIKAGAGGWNMLSRWINVNAASIHGEVRMRGTSDSLGYSAGVLQQLSYASLVVVGAWSVMHGDMTMGAVIASSILSGRIMAPILALPGLLVQHAHAKAASQSLERLFMLKSDHHGVSRPLTPHKLRGSFVLKDVKFGYPGTPPAVDISHLEIRPGERVGILGPIGAGKSTLLRLLAGLYVPQQGRILVDGLDLSHISRKVITRHIGYVQQDHRLFLGTLRENLLIGLADPGDDVLQVALERSGLSRLVASHPKGLALPIMEGGKGLSGGQRQLVAFTRLLLWRPNILLLDEPTACLDIEQENRCLSVLSEELKSSLKTCVVVTHKPSLLPLVDRVIVVVGNKIMLDGPRDSVLARLNQNTVVHFAKSAEKHPLPPRSPTLVVNRVAPAANLPIRVGA